MSSVRDQSVRHTLSFIFIVNVYANKEVTAEQFLFVILEELEVHVGEFLREAINASQNAVLLSAHVNIRGCFWAAHNVYLLVPESASIQLCYDGFEVCGSAQAADHLIGWVSDPVIAFVEGRELHAMLLSVRNLEALKEEATHIPEEGGNVPKTRWCRPSVIAAEANT